MFCLQAPFSAPRRRVSPVSLVTRRYRPRQQQNFRAVSSIKGHHRSGMGFLRACRGPIWIFLAGCGISGIIGHFTRVPHPLPRAPAVTERADWYAIRSTSKTKDGWMNGSTVHYPARAPQKFRAYRVWGFPLQAVLSLGVQDGESELGPPLGPWPTWPDGTKGGQLSGPWKKLQKFKTRPRSAFQSTDTKTREYSCWWPRKDNYCFFGR